MQPRCGQTAECSCLVPSLSQYTAIFLVPFRITQPESGNKLSAVGALPGVTQSLYCAATFRFSFRNSVAEGALSVILAGSYKVSHGLVRFMIRSVINMPAMVQCVIPWPESPVAI